MMRRALAIGVLALVGAIAPRADTRTIEFQTSEGTWMSVDVSPDGRQLVFDLLGDLYTLPIEGGRATRITSGAAFDTQPRWSPDGGTIVFSSDRSGSDNIWSVGADGSNPTAVTKEKDGGLTAPSWSPDGAWIAVRKDPTYNRRGSAELWLYHRTGGPGVRLTRRDAQPGFNPNGPVFAPDGRWVYFAHGNRVLDYTWVPWQVWKLDRATGALAQVTTGWNGAVRPALSRDGRWLAFVRRNHGRSALVLRDLATGVQRDLDVDLDRDDQRGTTDYDAFPGYAFMPDASAIVIATGGTFHRVPLDGGAASRIAFTADVAIPVAERAYVETRLPDADVTARVVRAASYAPDGATVAFEALGQVWIARRGGAPRRLTTEPHREYAPAVSPDGRWVAWVSWDDHERGHLWKAPLDGSAAPQRLTNVPRQYANPAWSPDGKRLVLAWRAPHPGNTANLVEDDPSHEIVWIAADGGETHAVASPRPRNVGRWFPAAAFSGEGDRVLFLESASETRTDLVSVRLDGTDRRSLARFPYVEEAVLSPDGSRLAFVAMDDAWLADLPMRGGEPIEIDLVRPAVPLQRLTDAGAGFLTWNADGRALTWVYGNVAFRRESESGAVASWPLEVRTPRARPEGRVLLRGARLLTMNGAEVVERGDILIDANRIAAVGRSGALRVPPGTRALDMSGKTIMPGLVDTHWHGHYATPEVFPQQKWQYLADLAYGVTTARELSAPTRDTLAQADLVETGAMLGPRVVASGWPLFVAREGGSNHVAAVESLEDARRHVRRLKLAGASYLKQYLQPRREQRQWLLQAAREEGVMMTAEGGGLRVQTTLMIDGYSGFEHSFPVAPVYGDIVQLLARTGTVYTPTFVAGYAKPGSMDYFYATVEVHGDRRLARFTPHDLLDRFTTIRVRMPDDQYQFRVAARDAYAVLRAGGNVTVGGHGNHPGIGTHWELWSFVEGGMPPMEALRAATMGGAECLGLQRDIGSLQPGKLADLLILNGDPRGDIRRTTDVHRVMKNGELFDPDELARHVPR